MPSLVGLGFTRRRGGQKRGVFLSLCLFVCPVEIAALHAATKYIINLTARTGCMYGGRPVPFSPSIASTGCGVLRSTATAVGRQHPLTTDSVWRSYCESPASTGRRSTQHATTVLRVSSYSLDL